MLTLVLCVPFSLHPKFYPGQRKNRLHSSNEKFSEYSVCLSMSLLSYHYRSQKQHILTSHRTRTHMGDGHVRQQGAEKNVNDIICKLDLCS